MSDDRNRSNDREGGTGDRGAPSRDHALAYMRNELTLDERMRYLADAADDPAQRAELATLRAAAQVAAEEHADATADASFARLAATLGIHAPASSPDAPTEMPPREAVPARNPAHEPWHRRLRAWWRAHGNVLQPALIALVIAQSGVIAHFIGASGGAVPAQQGGDASVTRGATVSCADVWVTFKGGVTERQLREWLTLYGANIAAGPDDAGRYRIATHDADSRAALLQSPEAQRLAARIEPPAGCAGK
ncbi:hypothetical protein [Paraburkholderia lycopersici]|uniref:Uncharacterized protein n=1 Tax=Paraburkholderia lycopersici TaxID=416944 RepID=A0A1G7CL00_9BURK|nr:hypothetical protein [Paraburkholderia lycopersici]SDE40032.1 hypothetical protein SAMN05421548_14618 [Paraburkholderia lycopersici]